MNSQLQWPQDCLIRINDNIYFENGLYIEMSLESFIPDIHNHVYKEYFGLASLC